MLANRANLTQNKMKKYCKTLLNYSLKLLVFNQVFKLFPILITILIMWGLCAILTVSGAFSKDNGARTDTNIKILEKADWFRFPYPCKIIESNI